MKSIKQILVKKIDEFSLDRKVKEFLKFVMKQTEQVLRIVVELKKDADAEGILNYLYKNTDLQVAYNFNMVAIHNKTTETYGASMIYLMPISNIKKKLLQNVHNMIFIKQKIVHILLKV